jgi:hypothetical protein
MHCLTKLSLELLIAAQLMHGAARRMAAAQTVVENNVDASSRDVRLRLWIEQATGSDSRARLANWRRIGVVAVPLAS